ncbi:hypothetical protein WSM22_02820 [Cytophagales bacterium WSM2-2]|nr:hypothetical protein WSM22_02820 [Cytophagales bacterium WSM2-2]
MKTGTVVIGIGVIASAYIAYKSISKKSAPKMEPGDGTKPAGTNSNLVDTKSMPVADDFSYYGQFASKANSGSVVPIKESTQPVAHDTLQPISVTPPVSVFRSNLITAFDPIQPATISSPSPVVSKVSSEPATTIHPAPTSTTYGGGGHPSIMRDELMSTFDQSQLQFEGLGNIVSALR